ncbi:1-(5-phosphoribosyl)-5-[(5-phosphoribosylamino)methylideneamino]imidazole-4-carboxamide isomerase [Pseudogracilibacillus auburnensis]|uniref:1-(5-phosphoribosyl)-5-[(5-phosphoribosylamino)methylideneamino] imidazole-4-carboxamide isomerase n=1 Tax=Pseudogracilibacillus auburnensis TaxID=1494959 RepID=A0A2V3W1Y6_9BACI|nr:1-(5-phosphoribosyl)-5-[(5-phosphoribosylamino)methylideneamino]imidazole-4-carboxamide isomerase [Pseudogracilibacillus auburnensis]MBO1002347.1 1-(5-phosphoribosyl)-5-[(5-phosphoribosylamino)methylideneamino]imidazole-4-carboxamide isomerase [Pseudogracilibacillus auburnensis]PXW86265.1 1-(5-phosphoribosyl)-5-[(5-phosphoribosylamino)methylideneamino] imidazole-4-carboxamide isomerase [Pseudogracilibacillus auburnensis]
MIIFPAIDILDGKCVRLIQGDYNQERVYSDSPIAMAKEWEEKGAEYIHIVDLNGAKTGQSINKDIIQEIATTVSIPIQVGGGIRSLETIKEYIEAGVSRVIIGTAAINDQEFLREAVEKFGEKVAVSIDARNGYVATDGWTDTSDVLALDLVKILEEIGVTTIVYTDIAKDGMLQGPNLAEQQTINEATKIDVIASGGVTTKEDVENLEAFNIYGVIIGKALYDGKLEFESLMEE